MGGVCPWGVRVGNGRVPVCAQEVGGRWETCSAPEKGGNGRHGPHPQGGGRAGQRGRVSIRPLSEESRQHLTPSSAAIVAGSPECRWC